MPDGGLSEILTAVRSGGADGSTPNPFDLTVQSATKFLDKRLRFLPRFCAIPAFECDDIDGPK